MTDERMSARATTFAQDRHPEPVEGSLSTNGDSSASLGMTGQHTPQGKCDRPQMGPTSTFPQGSPYSELATLYDRIYAAWGKDYAAEAAQLHCLVQQYKHTQGVKLLDLGCGTGEHLKYLREHYQVTGLDATEEMLQVAKAKLPDVDLVHQDMVDFYLDDQFDAILSLFSAISYVQTMPRLRAVLRAIERHLKPGGVTIIEPWFTPDEFQEHRFDAKYGELDGFKACRMRESAVEERIAKIVGHILVASGPEVKHFHSPHVFGLFTVRDLSSAIADAGLEPHYVEHGLTGIGLHIGVKTGHCEVDHYA